MLPSLRRTHVSQAAAMSLAALLVGSAGCASAPRVEPVPDSAWQAAAGSHRSSSPRARQYGPPPRAAGALSREQVLSLASQRDPQDAIAVIDSHPLAFPLDQASIDWFQERLVPAEVVDYLVKRSHVDWDALRGPAPEAAGEPRGEPPESSQGLYAHGPEEEGASLPPPPPSGETVVVERAAPTTTVIYETDRWVSPDPVWCVGGYAAYGWYDSSCYGYGGYRSYRSPTVVYQGSPNPVVYASGTGAVVMNGRNPVVVSSRDGSSATYGTRPVVYRQSSSIAVAPATSPAGLYTPRGVWQASPAPARAAIPYRPGPAGPAWGGSSNPTVRVTRQPR